MRANIYFCQLKLLDFIFSLLYTKSYVLLNASGAAALTVRRNVRGLSKADCSAGREIFSH